MLGSIGRTERTGPTGLGAEEWNTAMNRVTPPSTTSSKTTSAASRPDWGRASGAFSILTISAGRWVVSPLGSGRPVSGATGVWVTTVPDSSVVLAVVSGGAEALAWLTAVFPPQAAAARAIRPARARGARPRRT